MSQASDLNFLAPYIRETNFSTNAQLSHRIHIIKNIWAIPPGSKVLEIGCGQGDCTLVLAAAVGESGRVDAVDPASLDYGSPQTLGQAQAALKAGPLGSRINFTQADPMDYLQSTPDVYYDYVVLFHSLWYFSSPSRISALLSLLATRKHAAKILIAEWALEARELSQVPHVLATLLRGNLEYLNVGSEANIRTVVGPAWFRQLFEEMGLEVGKEEVVMPVKGLEDGYWEV